MRSILLAAILIMLGQYAMAKTCTTAEARAAETISGTRKTWHAIYTAYRQYAHCDDGAIAEGFTESVVRQLSSHWFTLPEAQRLFAAAPQFERFILKHIDSSAGSNELSQIVEYATSQCPAGAAVLCQRISGVAHELPVP